MGRTVTWVVAMGIASGVAAASIPSEPSTAVPDAAIEAAAAEQSAVHLVLMGAGLLGLLLLGRHCNLCSARSVFAWNQPDRCREKSAGLIETASPLRISMPSVVEVTENRHCIEVPVRDARPVDSRWCDRLGLDGLSSIRLHDPHDRQIGRVAFESCHDLDRVDDRDDGNRAAAQAAENLVLEIRIARVVSTAVPHSTERN